MFIVACIGVGVNCRKYVKTQAWESYAICMSFFVNKCAIKLTDYSSHVTVVPILPIIYTVIRISPPISSLSITHNQSHQTYSMRETYYLYIL